ncbi:MAG: HEPN domain-containing protein [Chakrabartia godavariana]
MSLQGLWWLPETPDDQESGTLTFDQGEGGRLNIIGRLAPMKTGPLGAGEESDVIHGLTTTGQPVSLFKTFVVSSRLPFSGIATETWHVSTIAIGAHFTSVDDALFRRSWMRFDGIAAWLAQNPFEEKYDFNAPTVELVVRKLARMDLGRIAGASIYTDSTLNSGRDGTERWTSTYEPKLAIDAEKPQTLGWHFSKTAKLRALAEMLFGRPLHLTQLLVELPSDPTSGSGPSYSDVEIHAQMIGGDDKLSAVERPPMLTAPALLDAAPSALADWFAQYDTLSAALHLFATVASDRRMFINVRFLLATQAVETFHREAHPSTIVPDNEHAEIVKALTAAIPQGTSKLMRDKLKGSLEFSNEPSLRQRLRSLVDSARDGRIGAMPAYDRDFINAVVNTRNYETHHGRRPKGLLTGAEMHWAIRRLVLLLTVLFLRRLGLSSAAIDPIIQQNREFHRLWTTTGTP